MGCQGACRGAPVENSAPGNSKAFVHLLPVTGEPRIQAAVKPQSSVSKLLREALLPSKPSISKPSGSSPEKAIIFSSWLQFLVTKCQPHSGTGLCPLSDLPHGLAACGKRSSHSAGEETETQRKAGTAQFTGEGHLGPKIRCEDKCPLLSPSSLKLFLVPTLPSLNP